jgi:hypothetical protein
MADVSGVRVSDDLRYELAESARLAAASNRPRGLLVLATVVFVVAGVALVWALRHRDASARQYQLQTDRLTQTQEFALQFSRLERVAGASSSRETAPLPDILTRIEKAAEDVGLARPPVPRPRSTERAGARRVVYQYTVQDAELSRLLAWVEGARDLVPGLEVASISLQPLPRHWKLEVTFVRWERS